MADRGEVVGGCGGLAAPVAGLAEELFADALVLGVVAALAEVGATVTLVVVGAPGTAGLEARC